jgi:hypothetical protein
LALAFGNIIEPPAAVALASGGVQEVGWAPIRSGPNAVIAMEEVKFQAQTEAGIPSSQL